MLCGQKVLRCLTSAVFGFIAYAEPSMGQTNDFKEYKIDFKPLQAHPQLYSEYKASTQKVWVGDVSADLFKRRIEILEQILKQHPNWIDGLWMLGGDTFQLASLFTDDKYAAYALQTLTKGQRATERCLQLAPKNPLCQLFLGSAIAQKGTIEGVMSSLDYAEKVENLWLEVSKSNYNFRFTQKVSMQGAVRYALGIFYRLVPDYAVLDWLYGVRGDIDKSVAYHRNSLGIDAKDLPCSNLMLGVALLCRADGDKTSKSWQEGYTYLNKATQSTGVYTVNSTVCRRDAFALQKTPGDSCGYSVVGQQEKADEDYFEKRKVSQKKKGLSH